MNDVLLSDERRVGGHRAVGQVERGAVAAHVDMVDEVEDDVFVDEVRDIARRTDTAKAKAAGDSVFEEFCIPSKHEIGCYDDYQCPC